MGLGDEPLRAPARGGALEVEADEEAAPPPGRPAEHGLTEYVAQGSRLDDELWEVTLSPL